MHDGIERERERERDVSLSETKILDNTSNMMA